MKIPFVFTVTVTLLLASAFAFTVRPNLSIAKDKVSTGSLSGAHSKTVLVHVGEHEPSNPGLPFAFGSYNKTTPISVHPNISNLKDNTTLDSPSGARDAVMHIHSENIGVPTSFVVASQQSNRGLPFTIALHNKTTLNAVVIRKISNAALYGVMWASIFFGPSFPPAHALTTAQSFEKIFAGLEALDTKMDTNLKETNKNLKETNKNLKELKRDLVDLSLNQADLSLNQADLSSKVDRNQQDISLKVAQLDLKIGQLDYKFFWIPISVAAVNAFSPFIAQHFQQVPKSKPKPNKPTLFSGNQNGTAGLGPFSGTAGGLLHGAQNDSISKKNHNESA
jgi:uncharacterized protein YoxC